MIPAASFSSIYVCRLLSFSWSKEYMGLPLYLSVFGLNFMEKCKFGGMLGMISSANSVLNLSTVGTMKWCVSSVSGAKEGLAVGEVERLLIGEGGPLCVG